MVLTVGSTNTFSFQLISFDPGLLALGMEAQLALRSASTSVESRLFAQFKNEPKAVLAPWEVATEPQTLARKIREVRNLDKFIDLRSTDVLRAGDHGDGKALFALYNALIALQTLAQYASEKNTPTATLARLDTKFQQGFTEIQDYMSGLNLSRLTLLLGEKEDDATSANGLGKDSATVAGKIVQTGLRGDALAGVAGNEIFKVRIEKSGSFDDISVDLSNISGTLNLDAIVGEINSQIEALTILDGNGNPVAKYQTRFSVKADSNFDFFIQIDGSATETVTLIPQTAEPVLYVTGTSTKTTGDGSSAAMLRTISSVDTTSPLHDLGQDISGINLQATTIQEKAATVAGENAPDPVTTESSTGGVAVDSVGNLYVVGTSEGSFGGQINTATTNDVFLTKFDSNGDVIYSRLLGADTSASAFSITIDSSDNIIIAGQTDGDLTGSDVLSSTDAFISKFDSKGDLIFTTQLDTISKTAALSVAVDSAGDVYVGGYTDGAISITSGFGGGRDSLILKLSGSDGTVQDSAVIGGTGFEEVKAIEIASDGGILIATAETGTGYLRKLDSTALSTEIYNISLGTLSGGTIGGIAVDGTAIYVTGSTGNAAFTGGGATVTNTHSGGVDGFVTRIDDSGASAAANYTTFVGSTGADTVSDITINAGSVYIAGQTDGSIQGAAEIGLRDGFAAKLNGTTGAIDFVDQFGAGLATGGATGIAFSATGRSVLDDLGLRTGIVQQSETRDIITQTSVNEGDQFFISVNGSAKRRIEIRAGDTFKTIANRINLISIRFLKAESFAGTEGPTLRIKAVKGGEIELFAGASGRDALGKFGINPGKLLSAELLFNLDAGVSGFDISDLGGVFGLDIAGGLHVRDKTTSRFALTKIDTAISVVQRAYRSLFFNATRAQALEDQRFAQGRVPPHLTAQIANFQDALTRLQSSAFGFGSGLIV